MDITAQFQQSIRTHALFRKGERIFVACSGGPDSVALFHLLFELRDSWQLKLGLLHFHHQLRGKAADHDERFVKRLAKRYNIPFYGGRGSVRVKSKRDKESLEEAARKLRYDFFSRVCNRRRIPKLALAHTMDDQAETVLMRVLKGTGSRGLQGIRRSILYGKILLIRPLLDFTKKQILSYLKKRKIAYCRDQSNDSLRFL